MRYLTNILLVIKFLHMPFDNVHLKNNTFKNLCLKVYILPVLMINVSKWRNSSDSANKKRVNDTVNEKKNSSMGKY